MEIGDIALQKFKQNHGNLTMALRDDLDTQGKLSTYYTPGVGAVSSHLAKHPEEARDYTWLNNNVAVVSDGTAVLGLGDIGPLGALPVMTGKAMLFKHFAGIDAVPIVLDVHTADEIVAAVKAFAPSFGGINLEDIAAPICFEVEERLKAELNIPVFHDDQHGTAIVVLAGLINALKLRDKYSIQEVRIVIVGSGAAGTAIANLLETYGATDIIMVDSKGIIGPKRTDLNKEKKKLLTFNKHGIEGSLADAMHGAHVFIGVSKAGLLTPEMVRSMQTKPIIFAMANPVPEIMPDEAKKAGAHIIATGRSDFPNQVNNALAFPGIFRGALDNHVTQITDQHKIAAARALASLVDKPTPDQIIPSVLDPRLVPTIANVIQ
jgi:malate dehydrogenase (oxaloacetate-decarboxylating)